jgi:DNA adenine methylase
MRQASPIVWFGGKQNLSLELADLLPPHEVYVEAFGGGGSVLLSKSPAPLEVYNDVDGELVNFFRCLREEPEELARVLTWTPYARSEWAESLQPHPEGAGDVERARRFYVRVCQSYGGRAEGRNHGWGFERVGRSRKSRAASFARRVDRLEEFARRLRRVQIDSRDWREILDLYDGPSACFYLDPPYLPETRKEGGYRHELTVEDHVELIDRLARLEGSYLLSGYDSELYRSLEGCGVERHEFATVCHAGPGNKDPRLEVVWRRAENAQPRLFALGGVA